MFKDSDGNYKLKIAFDYDDTLTKPLIFEFAQHLIKCGHDVWMMTARIASEEEYIAQCEKFNIDPNPHRVLERNIDLFEAAAELGIENKVLFTNLEEKKEAFEKHKFDLLFDDDAEWHCNPICKAGGMAVKI